MKEYLKITNECNMELMARYPDNHFDLAIVDPPYGIDKLLYRSSYGGVVGGVTNYAKNRWDKETPTNEYFKELLRVSKEQIVWGGNYFPVLWDKGCRGLITWDKMVYLTTMSQVEYAWYSKDKLPQLIKINNNDSDRVHPTQKPAALYQWLLTNYAEPNFKILDTHLGSGSIAIAVDSVNKIEKMNLTLTACELDTEYYQTATKRIEEQTTWNSLF